VPDSLRYSLIFSHEFAHFETFPLLVVYMFVLITLSYVKGYPGIWEVIFLFVSGQAAWEIMSEGTVILEDSETYRNAYGGKTSLPRFLFWSVAGIAAAAGWGAVLYG